MENKLVECHTNNNQNQLHSGCIMCGTQNPLGLKLNFTRDEEEEGGVIGYYKPNNLMEGYAGILHGGVAAALLDSAMTNCLFANHVPDFFY